MIDLTYGKQKQAGGGFAVIVWFVSGAYLFWAHPTASIFSWQSAVYFVVGMFAAAVVFGVAFFALERGLSKLLMLVVREPSAGAASAMSFIGVVLMIVEAIVIFLTADWVINWLHA